MVVSWQPVVAWCMLVTCPMHTGNKEFSKISGSLGLFYTEAQPGVELTFSQLN